MFTIHRILANYMVWHLIKPLISELSKPFRDASLELLKVEKGVEGGAPPWKTCVTKTNSVMGFATGYLYIKERSGRNTKEEVCTTRFGQLRTITLSSMVNFSKPFYCSIRLHSRISLTVSKFGTTQHCVCQPPLSVVHVSKPFILTVRRTKQ